MACCMACSGPAKAQTASGWDQDGEAAAAGCRGRERALAAHREDIPGRPRKTVALKVSRDDEWPAAGQVLTRVNCYDPQLSGS